MNRLHCSNSMVSTLAVLIVVSFVHYLCACVLLACDAEHTSQSLTSLHGWVLSCVCVGGGATVTSNSDSAAPFQSCIFSRGRCSSAHRPQQARCTRRSFGRTSGAVCTHAIVAMASRQDETQVFDTCSGENHDEALDSLSATLYEDTEHASSTGSPDLDGHEGDLSSLMDSFVSARAPNEPGGSLLSQTIIDFSTHTPSPAPDGGSPNTSPNSTKQPDDHSQPAPRATNIRAPAITIAPRGRGQAGKSSPRDDMAAFLPPDSPTRHGVEDRSPSSTMDMMDTALTRHDSDQTSRLLAETEALMKDTHVLTRSFEGSGAKANAALDFFEREAAAGRPVEEEREALTVGTSHSDGAGSFLEEATNMRRSMDGEFLHASATESELARSTDMFDDGTEGGPMGMMKKLYGGGGLTHRSVNMDDMPLGASIVIRSAESARSDPFSDFRTLTREQAEATGLFATFSGHASKHCRIMETKLRQDIPSRVVQDIFQSIIVSRNFVVVMKENNHTIAENHREHRTVAMVVGANALKARVMLVTVFFRGDGDTAQVAEEKIDEFGKSFFNILQSSFHEENVTLSAMMRGVACQGIGPVAGQHASLGEDYEGQLREAFRRENAKEYESYAEPLEQCARDTEWATALFIGALEPAFSSSGILMPRPPRAPRLEDIRLDDVKPAARTHEPPTIDPSMPYADQVVLLDKFLHVKLNQEMKGESEYQCKCKHAHVMRRVDNCDKHRTSLVTLLRDSLATLGWEETQSFFRTFGIANEAVLLAVSCSMGMRPGRLYITYYHVAFYSSALLFTKKKVVPVRDIVAVWKFDGLVGGFTALSNTHGELSFTIPIYRDRVFEAVDYMIKMHKKEQVDGGASSRSVRNEGAISSAPSTTPLTATSEPRLGLSGMTLETMSALGADVSNQQTQAAASSGNVEDEQHAQWL